MEHLKAQEIFVLGFDLRVPLNESTGCRWSESRRARFLIRPEVQIPVSVDRAVWPAAVESPRDENPLNLWNSISGMLNSVPEGAGSTEAPVPIQIGALVDERSSQYWHPIFDGYLRRGEDRDVRFVTEELGYDVADQYLLSGISNCMLSTEELTNIRKKWAERINS